MIIFISVDCPISNAYAPEINRICKDYEPRGLKVYLVHADRTLSLDDARKHAADFGYTCPILIDRGHDLVSRLGARVSSEAAVVLSDGTLAYQGRIDNLYAAVGKKRFEATTHDLRDALDAVLAGRPAPTPRTRAVGCSLAD